MAMKRKPRAPKPKERPRSVGTLEKILALIRARPGIRPSEINRRLGLEQSDGQRAALIKRGLIRKQKEGSIVRYFAV
jgi:predicted DNA-binding transcriptional regulator